MDVGLGGNVGVWKIGDGVGKFEVGLGMRVATAVGVGGAVSPGVAVGGAVVVVPGSGVRIGVGVVAPGGGRVGGGVPAVGVGGIGKKVGVTSGDVGDNTGSDVVVGIGLVTSFEFFSHAQQPATTNRAARTPILRVRFFTVTSPLLLKRSKSRAGYKIDFLR
jgi:hypothetical protein